ncbi:hypothetical protein N657DRAFT_614653 [Parathielavia appendiculata]|uniref:Thioesterase domain-containing protein n=1 Tax=Parathielavia appendiculata TaxID=2587402 RepID=A0AAN6Z5U6_9PEZI|nr:hypothetical protein N657DRAFT_614653 [Parathielavia appendiculata]
MGPLRKPTAQQPQPCPQHESEQIVKRPNHSGPEDHNQYNPDPLGHFLTIPWAATMLTDPAAFDIIVSDRRLVLSREHQFVRSVMSSETTVRACVTFCLKLPPNEEAGQKGVRPPISKSKKLLSGGGPENGEDPERPFLIYNVLIDLGVGLSSFRGMLHGGAMAALLDEAMCAAVNNQSSEFSRRIPPSTQRG